MGSITPPDVHTMWDQQQAQQELQLWHNRLPLSSPQLASSRPGGPYPPTHPPTHPSKAYLFCSSRQPPPPARQLAEQRQQAALLCALRPQQLRIPLRKGGG